MATSFYELSTAIKAGNRKALARAITCIENQIPDYQDLFEGPLPEANPIVVGLTGPPGAGKSTLVNALVLFLSKNEKKTALLLIDPSSPFSGGALLGDRLRIQDVVASNLVYIRSMASRGSLGGLSPTAFDVVSLLRMAAFDWIIIETVGIGQSEVEIAALADTVAVVLVPESGDEIQTIKSGIMEVADLFIVNKSDREGAKALANSLEIMIHGSTHHHWTPRVLQTVSTSQIGILEVIKEIENHHHHGKLEYKKAALLAEKVLQIIREKRTLDVNRKALLDEINGMILNGIPCNVYHLAQKYLLA